MWVQQTHLILKKKTAFWFCTLLRFERSDRVGGKSLTLYLNESGECVQQKDPKSGVVAGPKCRNSRADEIVILTNIVFVSGVCKNVWLSVWILTKERWKVRWTLAVVWHTTWAPAFFIMVTTSSVTWLLSTTWPVLLLLRGEPCSVISPWTPCPHRACKNLWLLPSWTGWRRRWSKFLGMLSQKSWRCSVHC